MPQNGINSVEDLRGKKVGCFPGPAALTLFGIVFEKHGLNVKSDLVLTELPPPLQIQALTSHQVDALATYEPIATQAVVDHGAVKFFPAAVETDVLDPTQGGLWIISSEVVKARPETVARFCRAIYRGMDYVRDNPREALQLSTKFTSISPAVASMLPVIAYQKPDEVNIAALRAHAEIMTSHKVLSRSIDVAPLMLNVRELDGRTASP
jgi:ABC-type nitrate/sulfonate/bicarbonate transport system substrate-binding protein